MSIAALFSSGRIVEVILGLMLLEALVLALWHRQTGKPPAPSQFLPTLISGALLLVALRAALGGAAWPWIALCLCAALPAHLLDLWGRRRP